MPESAPSPVLVRFGNLGDLVMLTAVARELSAHAGADCTVIGPPVAAPLLSGATGIGQVITFDGSKSLPGLVNPARWRLARALRAAGPLGTAYVCEFDPRPAAWLRAAGLRVERMSADTFRPDEHQIDAQFRLVAASTGLTPPSADDHARRGTRLPVPAPAAAALATTLTGLGLDPGRPWVVVHAGSTRTARGRTVADDKKHWPAERWAAVIDGVLADAAMQVVLTGTAPEADLVAGILARVAASGQGRAVSAAGRLKLHDLLAVMSRAAAVVSVDTGPAHVAAAVGAPLVVLFGATDPRVNAPRAVASPVRIVTGPPGAPSPSGEAAWAATHRLADVTPAMVLAGYAQVTGRATG